MEIEYAVAIIISLENNLLALGHVQKKIVVIHLKLVYMIYVTMEIIHFYPNCSDNFYMH